MADRAPSAPLPATMAAVQLLGHGGFEQLRYREDVPVPQPGPDEVLVRVAAAGVNNTDVNTRIGWYGTGEAAGWSGAVAFPRIQGADASGRIVAVGAGVPASRLGERVLVAGCLLSLGDGRTAPWLGSERDGAFAQFVAAPAADTYRIEVDLADEQLAAVPCAYGTAENLLGRARVASGETVVVTGASGNVGIAAVQLARRRGARVVAIVAPAKAAAVRDLGAHETVDRGADLRAVLGRESADVVVDVVGGPGWPALLDVLRVRGRYAVSGAIAGPLVGLDLRTLYLKDLTLLGGTTHDASVFPALVGHLERGEIRPLVSRRYPLREIVAAQEEFLAKRHVGKIVLIPPPVAA